MCHTECNKEVKEMKFKIFCSRCNRTVQVSGRIWAFRLRHARKDEKGRYLGWHCDRCADAIEYGGGY